MKCMEGEGFDVPVRQQMDEPAASTEISSVDFKELGNSGAAQAGTEKRASVVDHQAAGRHNRDDFVTALDFEIERAASRPIACEGRRGVPVVDDDARDWGGRRLNFPIRCR